MSERVKITSKTPESKRDNSVSQTRKTDLSQSISSPVDDILFLQRTIGNRAVQKLFKSGVIQAKLKVGQPNDRYEQEADRVAEQVMRMPEPHLQRQAEEEEEELIQTKPLAEQVTPSVQMQQQEEPEEEEETLEAKPLAEQITPLVQRQVEPDEEEEELLQPKLETCAQYPIQRQAEEKEEEEEPIQTKLFSAESSTLQRQENEEEEEKEEEEYIQPKAENSHSQEITSNLELPIQSLKGGGQPLTKSERAFFEPRFGYDFSQVQVHRDGPAAGLARSVSARAFTLGKDIIFGGGQYALETSSGKKLLAHELTHVVQQTGGLRRKMTLGNPRDINKQEADEAARAVIQQARRVGSHRSIGQQVHRQANQEEEVQEKAKDDRVNRKAEEEEEKSSAKWERHLSQRQEVEEGGEIRAKRVLTQIQHESEEEEAKTLQPKPTSPCEHEEEFAGLSQAKEEEHETFRVRGGIGSAARSAILRVRWSDDYNEFRDRVQKKAQREFHISPHHVDMVIGEADASLVRAFMAIESKAKMRRVGDTVRIRVTSIPSGLRPNRLVFYWPGEQYAREPEQLTSWFDPTGWSKYPGVVAQIFFPFDISTVDEHDKVVLRALMKRYSPILLGREIKFTLKGHADIRGSHEYNDELSFKRAQSVMAYLNARLDRYSNYSSEAISYGKRYANRKFQAGDRRVDIIASYVPKKRIRLAPVKIKGEYKGQLSNKFKFRTLVGAGTGGKGITARVLTIEIRNSRTKRTAIYTYAGGGVGLSVGLPSGPTGWEEKEIPVWLDVDDFKGSGKVTSVGLIRTGISYIFNGPRERGKAKKPVRVTFEGWAFAAGFEPDIIGHWYKR